MTTPSRPNHKRPLPRDNEELEKHHDDTTSYPPPSPCWWTEAVEWIQAKGGMVHSALTTTTTIVCPTTAIQHSRTPRVTTAVPKGTVLMQIPISSCVVSPETIEATPLGQALGHVIRSVSSSTSTLLLHHDEHDLLVSVYLAFHQEKGNVATDNITSSSSSSNTTTTTTRNESVFDMQPYLNTLPDSETFDALPRRWKDTVLINLLTGSCLLGRVQQSQRGLDNDYDRLEMAWMEYKRTNETKNAARTTDCNDWRRRVFPEKSIVDDMLAAVTSRAFAGMTQPPQDHGSSGKTSRNADIPKSIAMVPLLDLCNHHRGQQHAKNVSYQIARDNTNEQNPQPQWMIQVRAHTNLEPNEQLRITYGAQGNAQLLFNYGFCLSGNDEPDGSSNDIVECRLSPNHPPVPLRVGPKSYTFGCLVKALELFHNDKVDETGLASAWPLETNNGQVDADDTEDDMEAFLNACDEHQGDPWDDSEDEGDEQGDEEGTHDPTSSIDAEVRALTRLKEALAAAQSRYSLPTTIGRYNSDMTSERERFATILIASEHRTLIFYQSASKSIISKLSQQNMNVSSVQDFPSFGLPLFAPGEVERFDGFVADLTEAFIKIRYPILLN